MVEPVACTAEETRYGFRIVEPDGTVTLHHRAPREHAPEGSTLWRRQGFHWHLVPRPAATDYASIF